MLVRLADDGDRERWNIYVGAHQEVPPLARYEWCDILEHSHRAQTFFFLAEDDRGTVRGICATYTTKPLSGKPTLYSLRFGLVVDDDTMGEAILAHIQKFCKDREMRMFLITSGYTEVRPPDFTIFGRSNLPISVQVKKTVVMDLADSEEKMWNALRNKTRNMIRKSQKSGLTVERGFKNLRAFYDIYARRMLKKGVSIHNLKFFEQVAKELKGGAEFLVAKHNSVPVGGILLLIGKQTAIYPYQASTEEGEQYASNQFMIWEAMRLCQKLGITTLDMGESKEGGAVYQSKINFGGTPRDLYYYSCGDASQSKLSALPLFLFTHIPLLARKKIGPWIKQHGRII